MASLGEVRRTETTHNYGLTNNFEELQIKTKQKKKKDDSGHDFMKSLDPGRRKLSSVESERIVSTIDHCMRKVEIVTLLPFVVENLDRFSVLLGVEIVNLVQEYDIIEKKYSKALRKHRQMTRLQSSNQREMEAERSEGLEDDSRPSSQVSQGSERPAGAEVEVVSMVLEYVKDSMKSNLRSIARMFGKNPSALKTINIERKERASEANNFIDGLHALKELVFFRLVTSPGEDLEKIKQFVDLTLKDKKARKTTDKLSANLQAAVTEKDNEVMYVPRSMITIQCALEGLR